MVQVTLDNIVPAGVPADGWIVQYRIKGSVDLYTTPVGSPYNAFPIVFTTTDPAGTLYEGIIRCDCGTLESTDYVWETPCDCTNGTYNPAPDGNTCQKPETQAPTVTNPGYCLAAATNGAYTNYKARIYSLGFVLSDLNNFSDTPNVFASMSSTPYWANPGASTTIGVLNREGVWADSDCDGTYDPAAVTATIAAIYTNITGSPKTIYIGVAADNTFELIVNGSSVINFTSGGDLQFKIWHILPVVVPVGTSYINLVCANAGGPASMGMVVYDNTPAQIQAATSDGDLNIIFASHTLRGTTYDIATCDPGWTLDTSGGPGNFICRRTLTMPCNTATPT